MILRARGAFYEQEVVKVFCEAGCESSMNYSPASAIGRQSLLQISAKSQV